MPECTLTLAALLISVGLVRIARAKAGYLQGIRAVCSPE